MKRPLPAILLTLFAILFAYGITQLVALRFEVGDVYPEYSSLRSDPLGTMALYESLNSVPGMNADRDFSTLNTLPNASDTTYMHLATTVDTWQSIPDDLFREIERFVREGGRLVMTMRPEGQKPAPVPNLDNAEPDPEEEREKTKAPSLWSRWELKPEVEDLEVSSEDTYVPIDVRNETSRELPPILEWHSGIVFRELGPEWVPIYSRGDDAVVIERHAGRGSVVIATDSYFLSNEAMLLDRHSDLLAWFVGSNSRVVFDEAHLGVVESPGVATLMRRYRLHGFVAALVLLTGLFVWKNALSLVPPGQQEKDESHIAGKDSFSGFVNLLRRGIPVDSILATGYSEWYRSVAQTGRYSAARLKQAEQAFQEESSRATKERDPIRAYKNISRILHRKHT